MNKINIEILTQQPTNNKNNLSVKSILAPNTNYHANSFDSKVLNKIREKKREQLLEVYMRLYTKCIENIQLLNNKNQTDFIYNVPIVYPEYTGYTASSCIDFIRTKLLTQKIDSCIIEPNQLFITWKYLEFKSV